MTTSIRTSGIFWKFFFGFWFTIIVVTGLSWSISADWQLAPKNYGSIEKTRFANHALTTAMGMGRWGGSQSLINWLSDAELNRRPEVFVVDKEGREISGRKVPEAALKELKSLSEELTSAARQSHSMHGRGMHRQAARVWPPVQGVAVTTLQGIGPVYVFAVRTDVPKRPIMAALWRTPWWAYLTLMLIVTSTVSWLLASRYSKPVRKLNMAMERAAQGDFSARVSKDVGNDYNEIGALARQYDAMAERINGLLVRQKRLFHDVSHELRSPLARIDVAIALAEKNPDRSREVLERIEREVGQLDHLVDELLTYARLDDNAPMTFESADIVPYVETVVEDADFEGSAKGVKVTLQAPDSAVVNAHIESLLSALENLIRNALRFSSYGQTVAVEICQDGNRLLLTITDQGPGMQPDELERLFDPFVRGKNQPTGNGFGLGLAIAKRAVERHGGTLTAQNVAPHGLQMRIELPAETAN